ncbi:hypothetical protein G7Z17_g3300 [Cylindrodendrum hubeiense]|uniref:Uncharacterized protein n=1 Tax=Cylindrodendrum hubeiense TaxID=595255 RepID=A0A9P5LAW9_9HYPO|nr:hypothetical protein G7Z17_g3300 [Cylindrodendrum hubeiense]
MSAPWPGFGSILQRRSRQASAPLSCQRRFCDEQRTDMVLSSSQNNTRVHHGGRTCLCSPSGARRPPARPETAPPLVGAGDPIPSRELPQLFSANASPIQGSCGYLDFVLAPCGALADAAAAAAAASMMRMSHRLPPAHGALALPLQTFPRPTRSWQAEGRLSPP